MAINKKLIHFQNKTAFTAELNAGNILDTSIVFIKDTKEIWTHGLLYSCSLTEEEVTSIIENSDSIANLTNLLNNKVDKVSGKSLVDDTEINKLSNLPNKADLDSAIANAKKAETLTTITWLELKLKRDNANLSPGSFYRIIDYETTVANDPEARSAGNLFDIVVLATSPNTLNENAWAIKHDSDTYFANAHLDAWQVWYCLDNDTTRFQWADEENGKGVIYRLIDEWGNDCPYDFKNVQFKRCLTSGDFVDNVVDNADWPNTHYILSPSMNGQADMTADETDYKWLYTFTYLEQMQDVRDASLINEVNAAFESSYYNKACNCNEMQAYYIGEFIDDTTFATQALNNIVLSSYDEENGAAVKMYGNKWGAGCFNMTFHEHCYGNSFGVDCYCLIGFKLYYNTFGNDCNGNTFGNDCNGNTFGNDCNGNTFGNYCNGNTFGNDCNGNTFGNLICYITAGDNVNYLDVTGGTSNDQGVQNAYILNGTKGTDISNRLTVTLPEAAQVYHYVGLNSKGELKIWTPADLIDSINNITELINNIIPVSEIPNIF